MSPTSNPIVELFQEYALLYRLKSVRRGVLAPDLEAKWKELANTVNSIFSGMYRAPASAKKKRTGESVGSLRDQLPVDCLRVPTEADILCETSDRFFPGRIRDISTGGAYVESEVPLQEGSHLRLLLCTFRDETPLELEGRVAWSNAGCSKKPSLPQGAGIQFMNCDTASRDKLQTYVAEIVEGTLSQANLI